jgi:hypothetical protein
MRWVCITQTVKGGSWSWNSLTVWRAESNQKWTKYDSNTIHFPVKVEKDGEQVITYTVRYTW